MNIVVLMKQTPDISLVRVNNSAIELPDSPGTVNPFDEYAVEEGIRLKERFGGKTIILTLGSEKAVSSIRDCLALGADEAYLVTDPLFAGADSQATAKILAVALKKLGEVDGGFDGEIDIVIGGKESADEESSQTPAAIAALLGKPGVNYVKKIVDFKDGLITMQRMTEDGYDLIESPTPVIISCIKEIADPRLPSLKGKMAAKKKQIVTWSAADIGLDGNTAKSPTEKIKISSPPPRPAGQFIEGATPAEVAESLYQKLKADQAL
ncbi:MAG: electron transfer flavoprotein subunit beta/FixA family protein [candidate division Zixibacteria bacterium]|nr:electron transfer flavoprotein subunit beta/FixA family protein [candidate division Zixibacteria bacterium]